MESTIGGLATCVACGARQPEEQMIRHDQAWVCADCEETHFRFLEAGAAAPTALAYAGFWRRATAKGIDGLVFNLIGYVAGMGTSLVMEMYARMMPSSVRRASAGRCSTRSTTPTSLPA